MALAVQGWCQREEMDRASAKRGHATAASVLEEVEAIPIPVTRSTPAIRPVVAAVVLVPGIVDVVVTDTSTPRAIVGIAEESADEPADAASGSVVGCVTRAVAVAVAVEKIEEVVEHRCVPFTRGQGVGTQNPGPVRRERARV